MVLSRCSLNDVYERLEKRFFNINYGSVRKFFNKFSSIKSDVDFLGTKSSAFYVQFYPTLRCNRRCSFCYLNMFKGKGNMEISLKNAVKVINELRRSGVFELDVLGGEPFLHKNIYEIVEYAVNSGMLVNISTNGSCLDNIRKVAELDYVNIGLSLHGSKEDIHDSLCGEGSFKECLKVLDELGSKISVKTVVCRKNFFDIENIVKMLVKKGVKRYYLIQMIDVEGKESLSLNEFYEVYKKALELSKDRIEIGMVGQFTHIYYNLSGYKLITKTFCKAGSAKAVVFLNGDVYPCTMFLDYKIGNVFEKSFEDIWRSKKWNLFRKLRRICNLSCRYRSRMQRRMFRVYR